MGPVNIHCSYDVSHILTIRIPTHIPDETLGMPTANNCVGCKGNDGN
jgi:hypothetical protein